MGNHIVHLQLVLNFNTKYQRLPKYGQLSVQTWNGELSNYLNFRSIQLAINTQDKKP